MADNNQTDTGGQEELTESQLVELFHHDPMDAGDEASGDEAEPGAEATPPATPEGTVAPAATAPAEAASTSPPNGQQLPDTSNLPQQIADAVREAVRPPATEAAATDNLPEYMFQIPQQLQQAMESEDPVQRGKGYSLLISGALRAAHSSILGEVAKMIDAVRQEVPTAISTAHQIRQSQQDVFSDFYGAHEDLKNPALGQFIYQQSVALAKEQPGLIAGGWNPKFRDALAARVRDILKWQTPAAPKGAKGSTPPRMLNGGSRPQAENLTGQDKALADVFG